MAIKGRQLIAVTADHSVYETVVVIDTVETKEILRYRQGICSDEYEDEQAVNEMHRRLAEVGYIECRIEHFNA